MLSNLQRRNIQLIPNFTPFYECFVAGNKVCRSLTFSNLLACHCRTSISCHTTAHTLFFPWISNLQFSWTAAFLIKPSAFGETKVQNGVVLETSGIKVKITPLFLKIHNLEDIKKSISFLPVFLRRLFERKKSILFMACQLKILPREVGTHGAFGGFK